MIVDPIPLVTNPCCNPVIASRRSPRVFAMSMWWRTLVLSLSGIFAAIGALGGFDGRSFKEVGFYVVFFLGIPIVLVTIGMIALEKLMGKYGRYAVTAVWAAPGLCLYVLAAQSGTVEGYALTAVACFFGWAVLWFITAPTQSGDRSHLSAS
jgi:hypothetical protein